MNDLVKEARSAATALELRDLVRNGSDEASELRQSPEYRAAKILDKTSAEIEALREYAAAVTKALTGLTVGGSEFFLGNKLGFYQANIPACVKNIEWRMEQRAKLAVAKALHNNQEAE